MKSTSCHLPETFSLILILPEPGQHIFNAFIHSLKFKTPIIHNNIAIGELQQISGERLRTAGIDNPAFNAELMLEKILGIDRLELFLNHSRRADQKTIKSLERMIKRRLNREPLQHIIGETEFYGLRFKTDPRAMIPRPETETLVDWALEIATSMKQPSILDIGTGCGTIAVAVAVNCDCRMTALDVSSSAIELAEENSLSQEYLAALI